MDVQEALRIRAAGGMARLLLVTAAVTGFLLMHGLAATDSAGTHHLGGNPFHDPVTTSQAAQHSVAPVADDAADHDPASHNAAMAGCVFILLALAGGIVLRALGMSAVPISAPSSSRRARDDGPARAPPCPVFVSLCVFRL